MKITTAAELAQMSPQERREHFQASIIRDLNEVPADYLAEVRERFEETLAQRSTPKAS